MMMKKKVLAVFTCFNRKEKTLFCIKSLKDMNPGLDLDFIAVDDGSTDTSAEICDIYSRKDTRVTVIHKENEGQAEARNIGVQYSHGEFIGFADDDDTLEPEMFEILYKNMVEYNADISVCCRLYVEKERSFKRNTFSSGLIDGHTFVTNVLRGEGASGAVWDKLFKREILEKYRFPKGEQFEDYWVVLRAMCEYRKIYFDERALYKWIIRENSQSHKLTLRQIDSYYRIAEALIEYFIQYNMPEQIIQASQYNLFRVCNGMIGKILRVNALEISLLKKYVSLGYDAYKKIPQNYPMPAKQKIRGMIICVLYKCFRIHKGKHL